MRTLISRVTGSRPAAGSVLLAVMLASLLVGGVGAWGQAGGGALPLMAADFNHDGVPDVLVLTSFGSSAAPATATIAFGSVPYGTFSGNSKAVVFPSACRFVVQDIARGQVQVADFNGDGLPDIYFSCGTGTVGSSLNGVMLGNGDGTFQPAITYTSTTAFFFALGDFNHDGKLDVAFTQQVAGGAPLQVITLLPGNGDGTFGKPIVTALGDSGSFTAVNVSYLFALDLNGDGYPDLVAKDLVEATGQSSLAVFGNNKDGTFGAIAQQVSLPNSSVALPATTSNLAPFLLRTANIYGSGLPDLVVGNSDSLLTLRNTSTATTYSLATPLSTPVAAFEVQPGNFTGQALSDLAVFDGSKITVLANDGTGKFTGSYPSLNVQDPGAVSGSFAVADANGDGYADLYTASMSAAGALQVSVATVSGTASASSQPFSLPVGVKAVSAAWPGNVNFNGTMASGTQTVLGAPAVAVISSSKNPSLVGDSVTFSVAVGAGGTVPTLPSGPIFLMDGTTTLTNGLLDAEGRFSFTTSGLTQGTHLIQASYAGDSFFAAAVSSVLSQVVNHAVAVTPTLTWAAPAAITYGTALSSAQLNAVATGPNGAAVPGVFTYTPAAGTVLGAGRQVLQVAFAPTATDAFTAATASVTLNVLQAVPTITWAPPAAIAYGTPLSGAQLNAVVTGVAGAVLPGTLVYSPAAGTVLSPGQQTLNVSFVPTDAVNYTGASSSVPLSVTSLALLSLAPNTATLGDPDKTVTLTGSGFVTGAVVQVNGAAVATTLVNGTTLRAVIPATNFAQPGTLQVRVSIPALSLSSVALPLRVTVPKVAVTLGGPPVAYPGTQPALSFAITNPYPVALTVLVTLGFNPSVSPAVDDPAIQFANGGRSFTFVVPANTVVVPPIQLQAGTVAGTITIPLTLSAGGIDVTPAGLQPVVIVVPPEIPAVTSASLTRRGDQLTVVMIGLSNTREMVSATFHFLPAPGTTIATPDFTIPATTLFANWYTTTPSDQYGSTFTYTQAFTASGGAAKVGSVQITLTNTVGPSSMVSAQ